MMFNILAAAQQPGPLDQIAPLISALLSGGLLTAVVLWRKSTAENRETDARRQDITAAASKQAIEVFESSIEQLRRDLQDASHEAEELRRELRAARTQVNALVNANHELEAEVVVLRRRIIDLDRLVTRYEEKYGILDH
jgi:septal ring factor EnvC (AmiA/AmiB activator)